MIATCCATQRLSTTRKLVEGRREQVCSSRRLLLLLATFQETEKSKCPPSSHHYHDDGAIRQRSLSDITPFRTHPQVVGRGEHVVGRGEHVSSPLFAFRKQKATIPTPIHQSHPPITPSSSPLHHRPAAHPLLGRGRLFATPPALRPIRRPPIHPPVPRFIDRRLQ